MVYLGDTFGILNGLNLLKDETTYVVVKALAFPARPNPRDKVSSIHSRTEDVQGMWLSPTCVLTRPRMSSEVR